MDRDIEALIGEVETVLVEHLRRWADSLSSSRNPTPVPPGFAHRIQCLAQSREWLHKANTVALDCVPAAGECISETTTETTIEKTITMGPESHDLDASHVSRAAHTAVRPGRRR